jgi:tetratricopeptide (TPR) repeat protein
MLAAMRRLLIILSIVAALPALALAQDADADNGGEEGAVPASTHPGSDSPEAQHAQRAPDGSRRRAQAFLIPMDEQAKAATARVAQAVEGVLAQASQYEVVDLGKALSVESSPEQATRAEEGHKLLADANTSFGARAYGDAEGKYKAAIKALEKGIGAVKPRDYAEAWLRLAATQHLAGDEKSARESFAAVARLDPQSKLQGHDVDDSADLPLQAARADLEAAPNGVLELESRPAGARVVVDGDAKGAAPMRLELPVGRHLVRLEYAGYYPHAEFVEAASKKTSNLSATLTRTPTASNLNQLIAGAASEVEHGGSGPNLARLAEAFTLQRVIIGAVSSHATKVAVTLALVDAHAQKLLARSNLLLTADGTDADQVEADTQAAARKMFAKDAAASDEPVAPAGDRRAMLPGAATPAPVEDEAGLVSKGRRVAVPSASVVSAASDRPEAAVADKPESAASDKPAPSSSEQNRKKQKKGKGLREKKGTEHWDDEE